VNKKILYSNQKKLIIFTLAGLSATLILFDISNNYQNDFNNNFKEQKIDNTLFDNILLNPEIEKTYDKKYFENKTYSFKENNIKFLENGKLLLSNKEGEILNGKYDIKFNSLFIDVRKKFESFNFSIHDIKIKNNEMIGKLNNKEKIYLKLS
jgi:hypothetical protein